MGNSIRRIANNKKAYHDYFIEETFEAGIELVGTEVKSIREGKINLKDSYASCENGEIFVKNMHISPYEKEIYLTGILLGLGSFCFINHKSIIYQVLAPPWIYTYSC